MNVNKLRLKFHNIFKKALKCPPDDYIVSVSTIRRERMKLRGEKFFEIHEAFIVSLKY